MSTVDYLVIGHISSDITEHGYELGGTAAYSAKTADSLGYRTAIVTSSSSEDDCIKALPGIQIHHISSHATTTFENIYTHTGRQQKIHAIADRLEPKYVPKKWLHAPIVHIGPIADEIEPEMIHLFNNSIVGITPQGWLRDWDESGYVFAKNSAVTKHIYSKATAVILSEEDLMDQKQLDNFRSWSRLLILTQGCKGCTVTIKGESRHVPVEPVGDVDPTGAGDIFAAAFLIRYYQTGGDPWESARYANSIASATVSKADLASKAASIRDTQQKCGTQVSNSQKIS